MAPFFLNILSIFLSVILIRANEIENNFNKNYFPLWGLNHFSLVNEGSEVQLLMDSSSGSGFRSKSEFGSGLFHIKMKIPNKTTEGIITSFFLTSAKGEQDARLHDELDFEFIGTKGILQTNVFANDDGHREQRFQLWFDPSEDFHSYTILWNQHQIVFFVDEIPITVFKNKNALGVNYPTKPMRIEASIWSGEWAGKVDWSHAPFIAHYQDFNITGCAYQNTTNCSSFEYFWNKENYWELSPFLKQQLEFTRKIYMTYDYCAKNSPQHPECSSD